MAQNDPPPIPKRTNVPPSIPESNSPPEANAVSEGKAVYNAITDTVTGVNVRKSDNKFQALFILWTILICAVIGTVLVLVVPGWTAPWYAGAITGAIIGLIVGFFASGIYLMIYRGARHMQGKHD